MTSTMFLSFNRNERRRERRAELLRLNKEAEKKLRGEKVEDEKKWKGIDVVSLLKMFKQQKAQKMAHKTLHQDLKTNAEETFARTIQPRTRPLRIGTQVSAQHTTPSCDTNRKRDYVMPQGGLLQPTEQKWPPLMIKTSPNMLFPTHVEGGRACNFPTRSGRSVETSLRGGDELKVGGERHLRRFEGRVRVLSMSNHGSQRLRRMSKTSWTSRSSRISRTSGMSRTSSICSSSTTSSRRRRRRRAGRSHVTERRSPGGGMVERRSQHCLTPPPTVSPIYTAFPYKTLYPGII